MIRNVPGSFALFGTNALVKEYVFGLKNHSRDATFLQNTASSCAGSLASILVACPFDGIKTPIQSGTLFKLDQRGKRMKADGRFVKNRLSKGIGWGIEEKKKCEKKTRRESVPRKFP